MNCVRVALCGLVLVTGAVWADERSIDSVELKHFWLSEANSAQDNPAGYQFSYENRFPWGFFVTPFLYRENTSVGQMSYQLTELHLQAGHRFWIGSAFLGISVGTFKGTERFSTTGDMDMTYESHGLAGSFMAGYHHGSYWQYQLEVSPKGFRDGLTVITELEAEYRVDRDFFLAAALRSNYRDMEFKDKQSGFSLSLKYGF